MPKAIPAILENTIEEIKKRVEQIKPFVDTIHLDIMDGQFVPNTTFNDPEALGKVKLGVKIRVHLMIANPEFHFKKWGLPEVETIIFHKEAVNNMDEAVRLIKSMGKKVGIAVNPKTSSYDIKEDIDKLDMILVMGVEPGFSSQAFNADVLHKIKRFKELKPDLEIAVDGGVNINTKEKIIEAGADVLAANSAIFKSSDIKQAIKQLES